jgi:hypothetical protein
VAPRLNTGTVPSKALRETALALSGWRSRELFGVDLSLHREATIGDFMYHEKHVSEHQRQGLRVFFVHRVSRSFTAKGVLSIHIPFRLSGLLARSSRSKATRFLSPLARLLSARQNFLFTTNESVTPTRFSN